MRPADDSVVHRFTLRLQGVVLTAEQAEQIKRFVDSRVRS